VSTGDKIALISLVFTVITTVCVLFIAYATLSQTARPNITVRMLSPESLPCDTEAMHVFEFLNIGRWYASPMAVDLTVYFNFPPAFELREVRYGSVQEHRSTEVKAGVGGMRYLKAKGLKLSRQEAGEQVHILATAPKKPGSYRIRISAYSSNDASLSKEFEVTCGSGLPSSDASALPIA
jgi:hypothetical protein